MPRRLSVKASKGKGKAKQQLPSGPGSSGTGNGNGTPSEKHSATQHVTTRDYAAEAEELARQARYEKKREKFKGMVAENRRAEEEVEVKRAGVEKMRRDLRDVGMQPAAGGFVVDEDGVVEGRVFLVVGEVVEGADGGKELVVDLEREEAL